MTAAMVFGALAALSLVLGVRQLLGKPAPEAGRGLEMRLASEPAPTEKRRKLIMPEAEGPQRALPRLLRRLEDKALAAGVSIDLRFVLLLSAGAAVGLWILAVAITGQVWLANIAALAGVVAPSAYLNWLAAKRAVKTEEQFDRLLRLLSQGMRAGLSLQQALREAEHKIPPPLGLNLQRLGRSVRMGGTPLISAISELERGTPPRDMQLLLGAMRLHIETGAQLPMVLDSISQAALRRRQVAAAMRAATSLGRTQANILVVAPLVLMTLLRFGFPGYLDPLFNTPGGRVTLVFVLGWLAIGYVVMQRLIASRHTAF